MVALARWRAPYPFPIISCYDNGSCAAEDMCDPDPREKTCFTLTSSAVAGCSRLPSPALPRAVGPRP